MTLLVKNKRNEDTEQFLLRSINAIRCHRYSTDLKKTNAEHAII